MVIETPLSLLSIFRIKVLLQSILPRFFRRTLMRGRNGMKVYRIELQEFPPKKNRVNCVFSDKFSRIFAQVSLIRSTAPNPDF